MKKRIILIIILITYSTILIKVQALFRVGIFDIDDVMLNGLGVMVGYWAFTMRWKARSSACTVAE